MVEFEVGPDQAQVLVDTDDGAKHYVLIDPATAELTIGPAYEAPETSYLSVAAADAMKTSTAWAAATAADKLAALEEATRRIDSMILRGAKYNSDQALEFPRIIDGVTVGNADQDAEVPTQVLWACLEEAMAILAAGSGSLKDLQEQGVSSMSIGGKLSYTFIAGAGQSPLQSAAAKRYMRRYIGAEVR